MHNRKPRPESFRLSGRSSNAPLLYLPEGLEPSGRGSRLAHKSLIFRSLQSLIFYLYLPLNLRLDEKNTTHPSSLF